jgi:hypothetical protein
VSGLVVLLTTGCSAGPAPATLSLTPRVVSALWSAGSGGLCLTLEGEFAQGGGVPGEGLQLRLTGPSLARPVFAEPRRAGETCMPVARTPAEFAALRPGPVVVEALVDGRLVELSRAELDQATIDRMATLALERGRTQTGAGGPGGAVRLELSAEPASVSAGGTLRLRGVATNTGSRPVYRVRAEIASEPADALRADARGKPLDFGWLEPGESLELTQELAVSRTLRQTGLELVVSPGEQHGAAVTAPPRMRIQVQPLPPPALSVKTTVTPDRHGRFVREGSEQALRPGDDLHMVCEVRNFGDSTLSGGVALLRLPNEHAGSVRVGRAIVGDLPPGASTRAHFWFVVTAPVGSGRMPVLVEISDADLGVVHEEPVVLTIEGQ